MKLLSPAFNYGEMIPKKYTCDGQNINPPLVISDVPKEAKSLALLMEDPDVPKQIRADGLFVHWLVFDMATGISNIAEGQEPTGTPALNTAGKPGYTGPCPPDREHRYFFKLFALDKTLADVKISGREDFLVAIEGHVLEQSELVGVYDRAGR